ncbi:hypothetical protein AVEN_195546-1 [Araneus ventricosus]|uniref:Uncharacterized protein n=1 Tax=Araneus ventricosus TaxID=182803 RepID=A0A4Y2ETQ8_ARAVE|nr:hypothetical protein AVEN_195546-1 [Araneus ventricosus]
MGPRIVSLAAEQKRALFGEERTSSVAGCKDPYNQMLCLKLITRSKIRSDFPCYKFSTAPCIKCHESITCRYYSSWAILEGLLGDQSCSVELVLQPQYHHLIHY